MKINGLETEQKLYEKENEIYNLQQWKIAFEDNRKKVVIKFNFHKGQLEFQRN